MHDLSTLPLVIIGTVFAVAGVLLIFFRVNVAAAHDLVYRPWRGLIGSSHQTKPFEIVIVGSAWAAIGSLLAVLGLLHL